MADTLSVRVARRFESGADVRVSLDVPLGPGDVLALFGPSGAGKTTVLRMLAGLARPDEGRIAFGTRLWFDSATGVDVPPQQRRIGYVFQQPALFPHLTVDGNVRFGVTDLTADGHERAGRLIDRLGVRRLASRRAGAVSGGEAQRVALARAIAPAPVLLLLDEPFAAVDAPSRARLRADLRSLLRDDGLPAVLVTHDRAEVLALADRLAVIADGEIQQSGAVTDVLSRPANAAVAMAVGVETVVAASVTGIDRGVCCVQVGRARIDGIGPDESLSAGDDVLACIRAEDVVLGQHAAAGTSVRNHLPGRVAAIEPEGPLDRVTVDCGFLLVALVTRPSRESLGLAEGSPVVAAVKATAVHLIPR